MSSRTSVVALAAVLASIPICGGCYLEPGFTVSYNVKPDPYLMNFKSSAKLAIAPFEDKRPEKDYTSNAWTLLYLVPLVPFVYLSHERLDEIVAEISEEVKAQTPGSRFLSGASKIIAPPLADMYYPDAFTKSVASDLKPYFALVEIAGANPQGYDYMLKGALRATPYTIWYTSYGLSIAGGVLQLIGAPSGGCSASTDLDLWIEDAFGGRVWEGKIRSSTSKVVFLYTSSEMRYNGSTMSVSVLPCWDEAVDSRSMFAWHFLALKEGMDKFRAEIIEAVNADIDKKKRARKISRVFREAAARIF